MRYLNPPYFLTVFMVLCAESLYCQTLSPDARLSDKMRDKVIEAETFCKEHNLNEQFCFLIDMSVHSGKKRFFIYNFPQKKITHSGLVCHGGGKKSTETNPEFSNEINSDCTSLGKYRTGKRAKSEWGIKVHYKMHGLEPSNSNAFKRSVVLHSYFEVPDKEIYPKHLSLGWSEGCPVIADDLMKEVDDLLINADKPALLWIFK